MLIHLRIEARKPLSGSILAPGGPAVVFYGWLDLLRILSELLEPDGAPPEAGPGMEA